MIYKRFLFCLIFLLFFSKGFAQKLYIWCPEEQKVNPHIGFLKNQIINLVVFDGRTIPSNSKIECTSQRVVSALETYIQNVYPSCVVKIFPDSMYYKPSLQGMLTVKIAIDAYQAGFGTNVSVGVGSVGGKFSYSVFPQGQWNGLVGYYVQIFDNRQNIKKKYSKEIGEITTKSNLWGYKTAKTCLSASYNKANIELLSYIEDTLME